jgi:ABC-2 type transport system permease protein
VNVQVLLHRLAASDLRAQLDYQERIAGFHATLRSYFYPYFFNERKFGADDFARMPAYAPAAPDVPLPAASLAALVLLALAVAMLGLRRLAALR